MLEGAQDGGSGPGPTPTKVQVGATATPSPMAVGIIKAETKGEAAGRGVQLRAIPPNRKNSNGTQSGREESGEWREDQALLKPQIPG